MRICFIANEIFAFGKFGGFGRATRILGRELVNLGHEVYAVIPRRGGQKKHEMLDGIHVLGYETSNPFTARRLLLDADAQIYHSEEPSFITYLAEQTLPGRKHVITFRDSRLLTDWLVEFNQPSKSRLRVLSNILFEDSPFTRISARRADLTGAAARFLIEKAQQKYKLSSPPILLPTPVHVPPVICKSESPTVVFVSRLDRIKRPAKFYELAAQFPQVNFEVMGRSQDERFITDLHLGYKDIHNLKFYGFIDQFTDPAFSEILSGAWILVNTSWKEALPNSFLEAAAHQCAILSALDPDGFASQFGYHVIDDDYCDGLAKLLLNNAWREKGMAGQNYIKQAYSAPAAVAAHLAAYHSLLSASNLPR